MKRKFIVSLVIAGMVFGGFNPFMLCGGSGEGESLYDIYYYDLEFRGVVVDIYPSSSYWYLKIDVDEILNYGEDYPIKIGSIYKVFIWTSDPKILFGDFSFPQFFCGYYDPNIKIGDRVEVHASYIYNTSKISTCDVSESSANKLFVKKFGDSPPPTTTPKPTTPPPTTQPPTTTPKPTTPPPTTTPAPTTTPPPLSNEIKVTVIVYDQFDRYVEGAKIFVEGEPIKTGWFSTLKTNERGVAVFDLELVKYKSILEDRDYLRITISKKKYEGEPSYYLDLTKKAVKIEFKGKKCIKKPFELKIAIRSSGYFNILFNGDKIMDTKRCSYRIPFTDWWINKWHTKTIYPDDEEVRLEIYGWYGGAEWFPNKPHQCERIVVTLNPTRKGIKVLLKVICGDVYRDCTLIKLETKPF